MVGFEYQQLSILGFGTVDTEIIEFQALVDGLQRRPVAFGEVLEVGHEFGLFGPLGVQHAVPKFDAAGTFIGSSYCFMRAEDFARIGLLALRGGVWNGARLLPESWIDFARTPGPAQPDDGRGYGAHWWLEMFSPGGFSMNGYAGQWVACCPHRDLILVRHGNSVNDAATLRQEAALQWVRDAMACFR